MLSSHDRGGEGGQEMGWGFDCLWRPWGEAFDWSCSPRGGDIWIFPPQTWGYLTADSNEETVTEHMFPVSTLHACALILVLICRRSACDIAVGIACDTSPTYEDIILPANRNIAVFNAGMPAKLNSSQLRRHAGGKDWHGFCWRQLVFSYRNGVSGSTGSYVDSSLAYENQAFTVWKDLEIMEASGG